MKNPLLLVAFILWFSCPTKAQDYSSKLPQIEVLIQEQINEASPGVAVGIVSNGAILFESYSGFANLEHQIKVGPKTLFNLASVAKQFTALMVLDLEEKGKLSLNDDFRIYLPDVYTNVKEQITIQQLLNHTSGVRDAYDLMSVQGNPWWRREGLDNKDVYALLKKQTSLNFTPGSDYMYSNSGYILLTFIIAKVTGKSFVSFAADWFKDLGLGNTKFTDNYMAVLANKAYPYTDWGDGVWQAYPMITDLNGDGFLYTTLRDQLQWELLLQSKEAASKTVILKSQQPIKKTVAPGYGYGVEHNTLFGESSVNHSGGTGSYGARFIRFPFKKISIVVMTNNGSVWAEGLANDIAKTLLSYQEEQVKAAAMPELIGQKPEQTSLLGTYQLEDDGTVISLVLKDGELYREIKNSNPVRMVHLKGNVYQYETIPELKMVFVPNTNGLGAFDFELYHPTIPTRLASRIPELKVDPVTLAKMDGRYYNSELDVWFELSYKQDDVFGVQKGDKSFEGNWIAPKTIQMGDYIIKATTDTLGTITAFSLNYNRISNIIFKRVTRQ